MKKLIFLFLIFLCSCATTQKTTNPVYMNYVVLAYSATGETVYTVSCKSYKDTLGFLFLDSVGFINGNRVKLQNKRMPSYGIYSIHKIK